VLPSFALAMILVLFSAINVEILEFIASTASVLFFRFSFRCSFYLRFRSKHLTRGLTKCGSLLPRVITRIGMDLSMTAREVSINRSHITLPSSLAHHLAGDLPYTKCSLMKFAFDIA